MWETHTKYGWEVKNGRGLCEDLDINGSIMSRMGCKVETVKAVLWRVASWGCGHLTTVLSYRLTAAGTFYRTAGLFLHSLQFTKHVAESTTNSLIVIEPAFWCAIYRSIYSDLYSEASGQEWLGTYLAHWSLQKLQSNRAGPVASLFTVILFESGPNRICWKFKWKSYDEKQTYFVVLIKRNVCFTGVNCNTVNGRESGG
jgi:hypothetical protein